MELLHQNELERTKTKYWQIKLNIEANQYAASSYKKIGDYLAIIAPYSGTVRENMNTGSFWYK